MMLKSAKSVVTRRSHSVQGPGRPPRTCSTSVCRRRAGSASGILRGPEGVMAEANEDRRILAIMFTDVVGYTALTERDEAAAVRVRDRHRQLVDTLVKQFDGEVVDTTGDESLSIFPRALRGA